MSSSSSRTMEHLRLSEEAAPDPHGPDQYGTTLSLEDSQLTMCGIDMFPDELLLPTIDKAPLTETKRFTRPEAAVEDVEATYTFGTAPVHSKNQFSGRPAVAINHGAQSSEPRPDQEPPRQSKAPWRDPQTSPLPEGTLLEGKFPEGNTVDMVIPTVETDTVNSGPRLQLPPREEHQQPAMPSPVQRPQARDNGAPPIQQVESIRQSREASVIGDLDLPGAAKAKRVLNDSRRLTNTAPTLQVHQEPRETTEVQPQAREVSSRPRPAEHHLTSAQEYRPSHNMTREGHRYVGGGHVTNHHSATKKTPSECSTVKPASYVSNVSKRRHLTHTSRHSIVPDTPMQAIHVNMQAIESDRSRLRRERNHALQACQELQRRVQEATDRIAIGKNQLRQSVTEHRELGLKNQKLQLQVRALREDLEACKNANVKTETLLEDELKKSEARLAEADADFKKLKARCSALRDRLDITIREQKVLARESKQHWNRSMEKCQDMKLEIKGELQTAIDNVGGAVESIKRSTAVVEQASDVLMNQNILSLEDQVRQAEEQVRKVEEENRGLREELEYQRRSNNSIEIYKNDIISAIGALHDQFESSYSSQDNHLVRKRLDSMLSLLESSKGESQSTKQFVEGLEGRLKDSLSLFANEVHQSADSHKALMQEIGRIEQTLCCEMKTLRETHSTREAEMRRELASLAEEKAKSTASLEVERLKLQRIEEINEKEGAQVAALRNMVEVTKAQLLSATQRAETDLGLLRQEVAAKQQQLEALQVDSTRTSDKNKQEITRLTTELHELKKSAIVNQQGKGSAMDIKKLQESESLALQEIQMARSEIVRFKQESEAEKEELQKQLKISEQRHANLAHRMKAKGILSSPPGSNEVVEPNAAQLEKNLQQLAGTERYLEKLATEATDVKEMEAMIRTLVEIQGVLRSTLEHSIHETLQMELAAASDQQTSGVDRSSSVPASSYTATQVANPVGKQIILRTPSQDGEEPGVAALAPGRERMQRRIRGPEKSILRQTTGPTAASQPVANSTAQAPPHQPLELFATLPRGGRSYSRPVEGKPAPSTHGGHPAGRNNDAVQSIRTTLVGGHLDGSESDILTSLAAWKSGTQGATAVPTNKRAASGNDHDGAEKGRQSSQALQEMAVSENAGGHVDRPRKRMRTYTGRTRSQDMIDMPPSNQQA